ncbi:hypothetical protein C5167_047406 [Papaver somniferum]|uniref:Uncharacterized protein n=1 Tax=Papaver somniferum TaxID=3469 RepID=A0A4Y7LIU7_PAPSO|nr:hypothetical protein C5167_047406 [Papaver somniferum]
MVCTEHTLMNEQSLKSSCLDPQHISSYREFPSARLPEYDRFSRQRKPQRERRNWGPCRRSKGDKQKFIRFHWCHSSACTEEYTRTLQRITTYTPSPALSRGGLKNFDGGQHISFSRVGASLSKVLQPQLMHVLLLSTPRDLSPLISTTHRSRPPLPKRPMHLAGCTTPKMTGVGGKKTAAAAEASSSSSHLFKTPVSSLKNPSPLSAHRSTYSLPPLTIQTLPRIPLVHYAGG